MKITKQTVFVSIDSKTLLGFSDLIPANSAADWTTWEDLGSGGGGGVCVWGGGGGGGGGER